MSTPRSRDALSRALRDLRKAAGLTAAEVAERTGFSPSKISRFETGKFIPPPDAAGAYARAIGASSTEVDRVVELASDIRESTESRLVLIRPGSGGAARMQERIRRIEAQSHHIGTFSNTLAPGLTQTTDYARLIFESAGLTPAEVVAAVASRAGRQEQAHQGQRQYTQILTEGVLTWNVGGADLMARQCDHLAELAGTEDPMFRVGVIPTTSPVDQFPMEAFDIYDQRAVLMGTYVATALMQQRSDVDAYDGLFRWASERAVFGQDAAAVIDRHADTYRGMNA